MLSSLLNPVLRLTYCMCMCHGCSSKKNNSMGCGVLYVAVFITASVVLLFYTSEGSGSNGKEFHSAYHPRFWIYRVTYQ